MDCDPQPVPETVCRPRGYHGLCDRLIEQIAPPSAAPQVFYPSGLALPEAIDYLNAVWRIHAGGPLLHIARAESAARLALECAGADEFEARLSALCSILDHVSLPDSKNSKLIDLTNYLKERLDAESSDRTTNAIEDLGRSLISELGVNVPVRGRAYAKECAASGWNCRALTGERPGTPFDRVVWLPFTRCREEVERLEQRPNTPGAVTGN